MDDKEIKKVEEIRRSINCPKGFRCTRTDCGRLCAAKDIGLEHFLVCMEKEPRDCPYAMSFGDQYFCTCPLRVFLAKSWGE